MAVGIRPRPGPAGRAAPARVRSPAASISGRDAAVVSPRLPRGGPDPQLAGRKRPRAGAIPAGDAVSPGVGRAAQLRAVCCSKKPPGKMMSVASMLPNPFGAGKGSRFHPSWPAAGGFTAWPSGTPPAQYQVAWPTRTGAASPATNRRPSTGCKRPARGDTRTPPGGWRGPIGTANWACRAIRRKLGPGSGKPSRRGFDFSRFFSSAAALAETGIVT